MKVCFVPTMFPKHKGDYYGSFVFDDARMLVKKGLEVHVVTQHNPSIPYNEIMDGIHVHRFKWLEPKEFKALVHFNGLIDYLRLLTYLISLFFNLLITVRKYDIDIIHAHSVVPTGLMGVIVAKIVRKPIVITSHGMDITNFENSSFFIKLIMFSLNNCDKTVAVSKDLAKKIRSLGIHQSNITVLKNGVDINRFKPFKNKNIREKYKIKDKEILILFVGYLDTFKGIFEMMNAFSKINKDDDLVKLMIVGTGPQEEELKSRVINLDLEKSVIITGNVAPSDIHKYYQAADIFVLPSHTDAGGPPVVFIEAMACGLPVIGTAVGGIPEGIENGANGFIVSPKNGNELAKKLKILIKNEDLRKEFGNNSLKKIHQNSMTLEKKAEKIIELYKNQIKNHSK
jgi:L-malate glycosyltransferase